MLINLYYETYTNLKKHIKDKLKAIGLETKTLEKIFDSVFKISEIKKVNLINNCIKHNDLLVSKELAKEYPNQFKKDEKINLDENLVNAMLHITKDTVKK